MLNYYLPYQWMALVSVVVPFVLFSNCNKWQPHDAHAPNAVFPNLPSEKLPLAVSMSRRMPPNPKHEWAALFRFASARSAENIAFAKCNKLERKPVPSGKTPVTPFCTVVPEDKSSECGCPGAVLAAALPTRLLFLVPHSPLRFVMFRVF